MTPRRATLSIVACALVVVALSATETAHAQVQIDNVPEALIEAFRSRLDQWSGVILGFAKKVFLVLGSIELTVALARSYYQEGGTFDRVTAVLMERMMFLGFWATLLFWGTPGIWNLIESFQRLGSSATGVDLNPTGIFEQGLTMTLDLMALSFDEGILQSTALFFPLTILAIVFVFATAEVVGALIDAYVIASAGIVVLGLGGSRWTSPIAQNYLRYALGAGIHLMVVNLVAAVGLKVLIDISAVIQGVGDEGATGLMAVVLYVTGAAILFAYLLRRVPATVSSIVSGAVSADSGGAVIAAAASGAHMGASAAMMTAAPAARFGVGAMRQVSTAAQAVAGSRQAKNNDSLEKASAAIRPVHKERTP
ncbi:MAG: P-type conjugative transfer protein TrbL [Polyangiales bacterium]